MAKQVSDHSPFQKNVIVAITPEMHRKLKLMAIKENRMLSQQLRVIFDNVLDLYEKRYGSLDAFERTLTPAQQARLRSYD